jgi:O-antigen/teichoic acid export membrane protein
MARGALWMVTMRWLIRLIGLVNTAIIARLLVPEDFGLVALAMIAVDLAITLTDGDIDMALVRSRDDGRDLTDTGWTLKIAAGLLTGGALVLAAPLVADYFDDQRLVLIVRIAALKPILLGFENIGVIEFRRSLQFSREFSYLILQRLITFVIGLGLVFALRDYVALALAGPTAALVTLGLSYVVVRTRPRLGLGRWRELWAFSRWQLLFNGSRLIGERCDQFVIGHLAGFADTGLYAVGFDLAMMPTREIMLPAGRALMPAYATIADDHDQMKGAFAMVLQVAALIATSVGVGMSCVADDAVALLLGGQWANAAPFVRWLGLFGALEGVWLMLDPYLIAARHERTLALANLGFTLAMLPALLLTAQGFGIQLIPLCRILVMGGCLVAVLARIVTWKWISPGRLVDAVWRPIAAAGAMAAAVHGLQSASPIDTAAIGLARDVCLGAAVYVATLSLLWLLCGKPKGIEDTLASAAAGWLRNKLGA